MQEKCVKVRLLDAPLFLDREYDYSIPPHLEGEVRPGSFVTVPFGGGNRRRKALVMAETPRDPALAVKPLQMLSALVFWLQPQVMTACLHPMLPVIL